MENNNLKQIATALCGFHRDVPAISKDTEVSVKMKSGGEYSFKYADLTTIMDTIKKALVDNGLSIVQKLSTTYAIVPVADFAGRVTDKAQADVGITTMLLHTSGEYIESCFALRSDVDKKEIGGAITYGKRYAICAMLGLSAEDDTDAESKSDIAKYERKEQTAKPPVQNPPKPQGQTKDLTLFAKRFGVIHALLSKHKIDPTKAHKYFQVAYGVKSMNDLSCETLQVIIDRINKVEKGTEDKTIEDLKAEIDLNFTETMEAK